MNVVHSQAIMSIDYTNLWYMNVSRFYLVKDLGGCESISLACCTLICMHENDAVYAHAYNQEAYAQRDGPRGRSFVFLVCDDVIKWNIIIAHLKRRGFICAICLCCELDKLHYSFTTSQWLVYTGS